MTNSHFINCSYGYEGEIVALNEANKEQALGNAQDYLGHCPVPPASPFPKYQGYELTDMNKRE